MSSPSRLAEIFAREVLKILVGRKLLSQDWAECNLSWRHTGFNVHSLVRAKTKLEAERVGKYMIRPGYSCWIGCHFWSRRARSVIAGAGMARSRRRGWWTIRSLSPG